MSSAALVTNPQKAPPNPNTLGGFLASRSKHLAELLPKSSALSAEKLIKLALLAAKKNSELARCSMDSVFQALLQCAELGLDPGGSTGEAYLVPYKNACTLVIGFRGYITLARRSGILKQIETHVVNERDKFTLKFGLNPVLDHEPCLDGEPGAAIVAYCVARLSDGAAHVEVMTVSQINKIRDASSAAKSGPWAKHWEEMARKTVLRRAAKYLPLSPEMQRAMEIEDDNAIEGQVVRREDVAKALVPATVAPKVQAPAPEEADVEAPSEAATTREAPVPESPEEAEAGVDVDPVELEKKGIQAAIAEAAVRSDFKPILDRILALPADDRAQVETEYKAAWKKLSA